MRETRGTLDTYRNAVQEGGLAVVAVRQTYTEARTHLAELWDRVTEDRETVIIRRRGAPDVALISLDELASIEETAHLLRSPRNAMRLLTALKRALSRRLKAKPVQDLREEHPSGRHPQISPETEPSATACLSKARAIERKKGG